MEQVEYTRWSGQGATFESAYEAKGGGHSCWFALVGDAGEGGDVHSKMEKRILSALWPEGAYSNKRQMELSRGKRVTAFSCTWCSGVAKIMLNLPKPEAVYVPQIRVETSDFDRIMAMYKSLVKVLSEVTTTSPLVTKEAYPELCKSREKYFVAPINMLQSVGFERLDGVYCIPIVDDAIRTYAADMKTALEKEIYVLQKTRGDPEASGAWLPWQDEAITSRISWYADNVSVYLNTMEHDLKIGNITHDHLEEASMAWSWAAAYWYFEYYSIIRSEHRQLATQLLNTATKLVCSLTQILSKTGSSSHAPLWHLEYAPSRFSPISYTNSKPSAIPLVLLGLYTCRRVAEEVLGGAVKVSEEGSEVYNAVRNMFGFARLGEEGVGVGVEVLVGLCEKMEWGGLEVARTVLQEAFEAGDVEELGRVAGRCTGDVMAVVVPGDIFGEDVVGLDLSPTTLSLLTEAEKYQNRTLLPPSALADQLAHTSSSLPSEPTASVIAALRALPHPLPSITARLRTAILTSSVTYTLHAAVSLSATAPYGDFKGWEEGPRLSWNMEPLENTPDPGNEYLLIFTKTGAVECRREVVVPTDVEARVNKVKEMKEELAGGEA